jgi:hypothetical protein
MIRSLMMIVPTAAILLTSSHVCAGDVFNAYAPPGAWGAPYQIRAHIGAASYTISYNAIGNTSVTGEVTYVAPNGQVVTEAFTGSITFRTANVVAQPTVRFKGVPTGATVQVIVR